MPRKPDPALDVICPQCGAQFHTTRRRIAQAKRTGLSFCSNTCAGKYKSEHGLATPPPKKAKPENLLTIECPQCGKTFNRFKYNNHPERQSLKFCSRECVAIYRSLHQYGENSPHWKGGYSRWYQGNWKPQRRAARLRDNGTCQDCGTSEQDHGYQMDVHHIVPYESFDNPIEAHSLGNLITLCRSCHAKRHKEHCEPSPGV